MPTDCLICDRISWWRDGANPYLIRRVFRRRFAV